MPISSFPISVKSSVNLSDINIDTDLDMGSNNLILGGTTFSNFKLMSFNHNLYTVSLLDTVTDGTARTVTGFTLAELTSITIGSGISSMPVLVTLSTDFKSTYNTARGKIALCKNGTPIINENANFDDITDSRYLSNSTTYSTNCNFKGYTTVTTGDKVGLYGRSHSGATYGVTSINTIINIWKIESTIF